ncbi:MAG: hypothetical protein IKI85_00250 [Bacteroidales bacterium]|nr:hypothetical protein [Bacteroidales bacterium]
MNKQIRFLNKLELVGAFLFLGYCFLELEPLKTIFLILSAILIIPIVTYTLIASIRDKEYFLQFGGNTEDIIGNIGFDILLAVYFFNTTSYAWAGILLLCVAAFRIGLICYGFVKEKTK